MLVMKVFITLKTSSLSQWDLAILAKENGRFTTKKRMCSRVARAVIAKNSKSRISAINWCLCSKILLKGRLLFNFTFFDYYPSNNIANGKKDW